jgi:hypothetical protein
MDAEQRRLELVAHLRHYLTRPESHAEVTHSVDTEVLGNPPLLNGQQPDLLARGLGGKLIIGLVKVGDRLSDEQSLRQYKAFGSYRDPATREGAALNLAVPSPLRARAQEALEAAGLSPMQFNLVGINGF